MQTFIPATTSFEDMAKVLDNKRLNKQALEGWQILMVLVKLNPDGTPRTVKGWANHPAVKMWQGHEGMLLEYIHAMVTEWKSRGYKSTIGDKAKETYEFAKLLEIVKTSDVLERPTWMAETDLFELIASSHRRALLNKHYDWYSQFGWPEDKGQRPESYSYVWPDITGNYTFGIDQTTALRQPTI
jgi:hypothetical protein